jgi:hypothetical protein
MRRREADARGWWLAVLLVAPMPLIAVSARTEERAPPPSASASRLELAKKTQNPVLGLRDSDRGADQDAERQSVLPLTLTRASAVALVVAPAHIARMERHLCNPT